MPAWRTVRLACRFQSRRPEPTTSSTPEIRRLRRAAQRRTHLNKRVAAATSGRRLETMARPGTYRFKCTLKWDLLESLALLNPSCMAIGFGLPHNVSVEKRKLFLKARVTFVHGVHPSPV